MRDIKYMQILLRNIDKLKQCQYFLYASNNSIASTFYSPFLIQPLKNSLRNVQLLDIWILLTSKLRWKYRLFSNFPRYMVSL
jgi:hypothetical protein